MLGGEPFLRTRGLIVSRTLVVSFDRESEESVT